MWFSARFRQWWHHRRWARAETQFLCDQMRRDLEAAGFAPATAEAVTRERLSLLRAGTGFRGRVRQAGTRLLHTLLPSYIQSLVELWVRPAVLILATVLILLFAPANERVLAGLKSQVPFPGADRLVIFKLYPRPTYSFRLESTSREVLPGLSSFEQQAAFRRTRLPTPQGHVVAMETTDNFDEVLAPVARSFLFPQARAAFGWRNRPDRYLLMLARLKPGVGISEARQELLRRKELGWASAFTLEEMTLHRPIVPAVLWGIPVFMLLWSLAGDLLRERRLLVYRLYGLFTLLALGVFAAAVWVLSLELWDEFFPVPSTGQVLVFIGIVLVWLLVSAIALVRWGHDFEARCRGCLRRLRLPLEEGVWGALLVRPQNVQTLCPWGHGQLTVDRLSAHWQFSPGLWEELTSADRQLSSQDRPTDMEG